MDIAWLYLKTFFIFLVITSISFNFIFNSNLGGVSYSSDVLFVGAVICSIIMALILVPRQIGENGIYPYRASKEILIKKDLVSTRAKAKEVMEMLGYKIKNQTETIITGSSIASFSDWGSNVTVILGRSGKDTKVMIFSKPKLFISYLDGGRNFMNVERIANNLNS